MKRKQLLPSLLLTGSAIVLITTPGRTQEVQVLDKKAEHALTDKGVSFHQALPRKIEGPFPPTKEIRRLSEIERPITSAQKLVQSPAPTTPPATEIVPVTTVKANATKNGVEVILQTPKGQQLQLTNRSAGNSFIADIPNAQLRLPSGDAFTFRSTKPIAGIAEITVINIDANTIRVTVTGEAVVPTVELYDSPQEGLILSVATAASSTQQQQQQPQTQQKPGEDQPGNQTQPTQPSASGDEPIELVVTGEQDGYNVPNATTGTRTDTPLRDIPQSIQVIPEQVLRDRQVNRLEDALRNANITPSGTSPRGSFESFRIRGFDVRGNNIFRNGLRDGSYGQVPTETANLERIEVLRGPASVLFGQGTPGGIINLITKKPLADSFYDFGVTVGSYDFYRGTADLTGPLNDNKTVLYRLNASYQDSGSFVDFFETRRLLVAPVITWAISPNTTLNLDAEIIRSTYPNDRGLPAIGTVLNNPNGKIPINRNVNEPGGRDFIDNFIDRFGYTLEHRFSENWSLRNAFRTTFYSYDQEAFYPTGLEDDNRTLNRGANSGTSSTNIYSLTADILGKFQTGPVKHTLLFGVDLYREDLYKNKFDLFEFTSLDLFNPVYGGSRGAVTFSGDNATLTDSLGIFFQDQIALTDNLKLLLGGRFDFVEQTQRDFLADTKESQSDDAFSPRVGIVYQPIEPISLYASYTRSFVPVVGSGFDNRLFEPERGTQYEIGVKADLSNTLSATLAFYQLTLSNVQTPDPRDPNFSIQTGEQRSRGIELNLTGEILPGWNIIAGYAYTDATVTKDPTNEGNRLNNVPEHSLSLWTTYEIQQGSLKGLGLGLGLFFVGEREGDLGNTFTLPSYLRTDASIFYKRNNFQATLGIKNLFDIEYFETAQNQLRVFPGAPLTVQGTVSVNF
jgi:iron complex outermembrane receptor protein